MKKVVYVILNTVPQKTRNCPCCLDLAPAATPVPAGSEGLGWLHELSTSSRKKMCVEYFPPQSVQKMCFRIPCGYAYHYKKYFSRALPAVLELNQYNVLFKCLWKCILLCSKGELNE